jgi:thioredoxin 1
MEDNTMAVMTITKDNFEAEVLTAQQPVLIDFWAAWCGPCKMMGPVIDQIAEENEAIKVGKINIDEQQELAMKYGIMSIPTVVLFENGQPKETSVGLVPKESIEKMLK